MKSRREVILQGCAAVVMATLAARSTPAQAGGTRSWAPRIRCPHVGCRHHRPVGGGTCGFVLRGAQAVLPDEPLPSDPIPVLELPNEETP